MSDRWRCFVGVPIGERLRDALIGATSVWQEACADAGLRWTDPAGWHLTLAFLGDLEATRAEAVATLLAELVGAPGPMTLQPGELVAWPREHEARMAWCRFAWDPALDELHGRVAGGLGVRDHRRFRPHVTLARVRGGRTARLDRPAALAGVALPPSPVEEVVLYRSHPGLDGSRYEPISRVSLAGVPA